MQIRRRIFNCTDMQIMHFILDKILKLFIVLHGFLSLFVAKLSYPKNSLVFRPTLWMSPLKLFKTRLDKFRRGLDKDVMFDWTAEITGTGDISKFLESSF